MTSFLSVMPMDWADVSREEIMDNVDRSINRSLNRKSTEIRVPRMPAFESAGQFASLTWKRLHLLLESSFRPGQLIEFMV